jgi:hypothetical protein
MKAIRGSGGLLTAFAVSLIAVACGGGGSSATPTGRASVTPPASASASAPPLVQEGGAPLEPGTYTTVFKPKITFTTDASWVSYADTPDFVEFERVDGHGGIGFKRVDRVFDPARAHKLMPVPKNYVAWIATLPGVKVLASPKAVTVDGVKGTEIDVQATKDAPTVYCKDPCVALWPLGSHADSQGEVAALSSDFVTRIVVIRLHGETVEISACCAPSAGFAALAQHFDAMLQTVRFG